MKKINIPKLRFKNFNDEWEIKKLKEIGNTFTGISGKTKDDFGHGDGKFVTYVNVFNNPVSDISGVDKIEIDDKQNALQKGDILFTTSSETPNEVGMSSVWLSDEKNVYLNSFCFGFRPEESLENYYMAYMLRSVKARKKISYLAQGISRYNISKNAVLNLDFSFPSLPEQSIIGALFQTLDELLSAYKDNLANYQDFKATMLSKMFPKAGQTTPEIRLDGFDGEWEEKKLGELAIVLDGDRGKNYPSESDLLEDGHTLFLSANNITKNGFIAHNCQYMTEEKSASMGKGKISLNDIVLTSRGTVGNVVLFDPKILKHFPHIRINSGMLIMRVNDYLDSKYFVQYLKSSFGFKQIEKMSFGSAQPQLTKNGVSHLKIPISKLLDEQRAISSFFSNLDTLISSYQEKINQLETLKKKLLKDMFF